MKAQRTRPDDGGGLEVMIVAVVFVEAIGVLPASLVDIRNAAVAPNTTTNAPTLIHNVARERAIGGAETVSASGAVAGSGAIAASNAWAFNDS